MLGARRADEDRPERQAEADGDVTDDYRTGSILNLLQSGEDPILRRKPSGLR
jgi:hypothetical protein